MLARMRKAMEEREGGFTLIELLVVMIIIGILAGIAIPVFLKQRQKAYDSQTRSDVRNAATAEEAYFTDNDSYTTDTTALASQDGWKQSQHDKTVVVTAVTDLQTGYLITATSDSTAKWCFDSTNSGKGVYKC